VAAAAARHPRADRWGDRLGQGPGHLVGYPGFDGDGQDPGVRGKTRAALAGEITVLAPLLADASDEVRDAAAWALPQSLAADHLIPLLRDRWVQEANPAIAASVLQGLSFLDRCVLGIAVLLPSGL